MSVYVFMQGMLWDFFVCFLFLFYYYDSSACVCACMCVQGQGERLREVNREYDPLNTLCIYIYICI